MKQVVEHQCDAGLMQFSGSDHRWHHARVNEVGANVVFRMLHRSRLGHQRLGRPVFCGNSPALKRWVSGFFSPAVMPGGLARVEE